MLIVRTACRLQLLQNQRSVPVLSLASDWAGTPELPDVPLENIKQQALQGLRRRGLRRSARGQRAEDDLTA